MFVGAINGARKRFNHNSYLVQKINDYLLKSHFFDNHVATKLNTVKLERGIDISLPFREQTIN